MWLIVLFTPDGSMKVRHRVYKCHHFDITSKAYVIIAAGISSLIFLYRLSQKSLYCPDVYFDDIETLVELLDVSSLEKLPYVNHAQKNVSRLASSQYAKFHPSSFIARYQSFEGDCNSRPHKPFLISALDTFNNRNKSIRNLIHAVQKRGFLLVYSEFHSDISSLQKGLRHVLQNHFINQIGLTCGTDKSKLLTMKLIKNLVSESKLKVNVLPIELKDAVSTMLLARSSKLLLVHGSSGAALVAMCAAETVYFTDSMRHFALKNQYRWSVPDLRPANADIWSFNRPFIDLLNDIGNAEPSCCEFEPYGHGDGEKMICKNSKFYANSVRAANKSKLGNCWIMSLGCGAGWHFERSVLSKTPCDVHVYDCTADYDVPLDLKPRVMIHHACIGTGNENIKNFFSYSDLIQLAMTKSSTLIQPKPSLLKIDVEGWEHVVFHDMLGSLDDHLLPEQIAAEFHAKVFNEAWAQFNARFNASHSIHKPRIKSLMEKFKSKGYVLSHRADNPFCPACSEVNLIREGDLPGE